MKSNAHRFRFYKSTTGAGGVPVPDFDNYIVLTINPIVYDGFGDKDLNEVETLFESRGTLVEETYFDHRPRTMEWNNIAKFKYFDELSSSVIEGGTYPQFIELVAMEYHRSGELYFLDDRGYTIEHDYIDPSRTSQVYIQIRIDSLKIDGFAKVPAPYFNEVVLEYTPITTYVA